ncbi:tyrosine-type recombinase/integrase [Sagittula sp. S175]|uniref:tyrosine-type recombinase/integrase n=1 Tax=Sagittula sp. S175 TaxID=3415129 RepID=UPI003C7CED32
MASLSQKSWDKSVRGKGNSAQRRFCATESPGLVFHSLRHAVVTRLGQTDVPEPIIQCIVGHARSGVTQEVYLREGYTLAQLKDAIDRFAVAQAN